MHMEQRARLENVVPDIFRFEQTLMLHTGSTPVHPANRRVVMTVGVRELQKRYGLCEDALQFVCQVRSAANVAVS